MRTKDLQAGKSYSRASMPTHSHALYVRITYEVIPGFKKDDPLYSFYILLA